MMNTQTFDLGTDNLLTDEPAVVEWMKATANVGPLTP
jgi:hypothetical protein